MRLRVRLRGPHALTVVLTRAGKRVTVHVPAGGTAVSLRLPTRHLERGRYRVSVSADGAAPSWRGAFTVIRGRRP